MYLTMLKQELLGRKRQTIIVATGLAIAIALVIVVSALSSGIKDAQTQALENVYGIGTDLTVTGAPQMPGEGSGGPRFEFDQSEGTSQDGTTKLNRSMLMTPMGRGTLEASTVQTLASLQDVVAATGVLDLTNTSFTGEMPDFSQMQEQGEMPEGGGRIPGGDLPRGADGEGGSAFGIEAFSVLGVDPSETQVGPLSATQVVEGREFSASDSAELVALIDETYASTNEVAVGDHMTVGSGEVEIVGVVASVSDSADTAANLYLPIQTAQNLAGLENVVSAVYVTADSASSISSLKTEIENALPDATVSSQSDLAEQVSGSLSSAASLISNLGTWLSVIVLVVALLIAILLTSSGVRRRTREFGTLKAIGWTNPRVISQVAGESMVQASIGGIAGLALGLGVVGIINLVSPSISTTPNIASDFPSRAAGQGGFPEMPGGGIPGGGLSGGLGEAMASTAEIVLRAPVTPWIVASAIGLAILGGLLAGAFGGWRVSRLSPVEALRSVA